MDYQYDITVIGAGPGGYETAIKAAQMGKKTCVIESTCLGDTYLNVGCIPTKTLIKMADVLDTVKHAADFTAGGVDLSALRVDMAELQEHRQKMASTLVGGIRGLLRGNKVDILKGAASFTDTHTLTVEDKQVSAEYIIVATDFSVFMSSFIAMEGKSRLFTNMEALELDKVPDSITVIGGGTIGVGFAFLLSRLGSKVIVLELMDHILPMVDPEVSTLAQKHLERGGVTFHLGARVSRMENNRVYYKYNDAQKQLEAGAVLMAVSRTPDTEGLNAQGIDLEFDRNAIKTDLCLHTNVPNIYATGDINDKVMLAHIASHGGMVAMANICDRHEEIHYDRIPSCIYLEPEIACIGLTEPQARGGYGDSLEIGRFSMMTNRRSLMEGSIDGLSKVIVAGDTGEILGVHLYGQHVTDMIGEVSAAMTAEATVEELIGSIHPHPTVNEVLGKAFMTTWNDKAINSLQAMEVLCMGDSFTFGYGVSTVQRWTALCGQVLGIELMSCAVGGSTTGGMLARLEYQMDRVRPGMVLLMGRFNGILLGSSDATAQGNLGAMGHITTGQDAIPVFGTPPLPYPPVRVKWNGLADLERTDEQAVVYQDWIRRTCGVFGYPLLDLHQELIRVTTQEGRPLSDYFLGGLHMNEEGNRAITEAAAPTLHKIVER